MAKLMVHRNVLKSFGKLPLKIQKRVAEFIDVFQEDPAAPSLHVHALKETMTDPKVRGATLPDGYRAILIRPDRGDTHLLVHVAPHDEAYAWARNKRFEVHSMTGIFQVFDVQEAEDVLGPPALPAEPDYPLKQFSDDELFTAGVPRALIPAVRAVSSDSALEALSNYLPPGCRDVLMGLAAGMTIDEALDEMLGIGTTGQEVDVGDFSGIDQTPNFDLLLVEGEEHLKSVLQASLEEWRVFLHPYQRKLVEWDVKGPMSITGAAGTGKTVAVMHRAIHLARHLESPRERVLLTTFTTNLSITIKDHLRRLDSAVADRIEVTNLHSLARTICSRSGWRGRIVRSDEVEEIWDDVWQDPSLEELPMSREELQTEYWDVIDANGIDDEETYLTTVRSGRPRISRQQRRAAWPAFRAFQRALKKRNLLTFEGAVHHARLASEQSSESEFRHVLVDEAQDFSLEALRLIRALSPTEAGVRNPLTLAGDGHQRIYRRRIPMSRAGIAVRGRSRRLKINYRTSEQIRSYAQGMLSGMEIDDLDGGSASIVGDHSVFRGPEPQIVPCSDSKDECKALVEWVSSLTGNTGLATHEICVTPYRRDIREALTEAGIPTFELKPREMDPGSEEAGVRLGTMKRIKGLEFRGVAMACAETDDPINNLRKADAIDRCERYVAATRAREALLITVAASGRSPL